MRRWPAAVSNVLGRAGTGRTDGGGAALQPEGSDDAFPLVREAMRDAQRAKLP